YLMLSHVLDVWLRILHEPEVRAATLKVFEKKATVEAFEALQRIHIGTEIRLQLVAILAAVIVATIVYRFAPADGGGGKSH
ncbi:MAG: hypothetical protein U0704_14420, partial [Candidatus Eisenbacteria bacterium]